MMDAKTKHRDTMSACISHYLKENPKLGKSAVVSVPNGSAVTKWLDGDLKVGESIDVLVVNQLWHCKLMEIRTYSMVFDCTHKIEGGGTEVEENIWAVWP